MIHNRFKINSLQPPCVLTGLTPYGASWDALEKTPWSTHCILLQIQSPWLLFGLTTTIGFLMLALGLIPLMLANSSASWPKVPAKIIKSITRSARDSSLWDIELCYEYEFNGSLRAGKRRRWGIPMTMKKDEVNILANRYKEGSAVDVRVHPRYGWSVLETVPHGGLQFYLLFSAIMFVAATKSLFDALNQ